MNRCPKCAAVLADDRQRFCPKCDAEIAPLGVKRTPEKEAVDAKGLVGDKNLINNSTIVGKQEKYEASNITIHNNITEDHSRVTVLCALSGLRVYLDQSVVCPQCERTVAKEHYVGESRRCTHCQQRAQEEFREEVARIVATPGALDAAKRVQIEAVGKCAGIAIDQQNEVLKVLCEKIKDARPVLLSSVQRSELDAALRLLIEGDGEDATQQKGVDMIVELHGVSSNYEVGYWHNLLKAIIDPEATCKEYEEELTDDYWQRYWGFLAYCKVGSVKGSQVIERLKSAFPEHEEDIRMAETIYCLTRLFDLRDQTMLQRAAEQFATIRKDHLSKPLQEVYDATQTLVEAQKLDLEGDYSRNELFVFINIFGAGGYFAALHERQQSELQAQAERQAAEVEREQQRRQEEEQHQRDAEAKQFAEEQALHKQQEDRVAERKRRMDEELARLGGDKQSMKPSQGDDGKAFVGYETRPLKDGKWSLTKKIVVGVACVAVLILILFLIPAPGSN